MLGWCLIFGSASASSNVSLAIYILLQTDIVFSEISFSYGIVVLVLMIFRLWWIRSIGLMDIVDCTDTSPRRRLNVECSVHRIRLLDIILCTIVHQGLMLVLMNLSMLDYYLLNID